MPRFMALRLLVIALVLPGTAVALVVPVGAVPPPKAGVSIDQTSGSPLTVNFLAVSSGFATPVTTYRWRFGDGATTTTSTPTVSHSYAAFATYTVNLTESNANQTARVSGPLELSQCAGPNLCQAVLSAPSGLPSLQASGAPVVGAVGALDLFVARYLIAGCERQIGPDVAVADFGFSSDVTLNLVYHPWSANNAEITCFSSPVPFFDANGSLVHSGPLPGCSANPAPPCVVSVNLSGSGPSLRATKVILVPPGDPRVGAH